MTMTIVGSVLVLLGAAVFAAGAVGLVRLPDVYARISAITTASGVGISLLILGALCFEPSPSNAVKALLAIVINLATSAVGGNALGRAAYLVGAPLSPRTSYDQMRTAKKPGPHSSS
ncbi:MAG: monovalent cation/H(+) antiporter subunit G [Rhodococcus sp.]|nr:monovalent cation/H(+) antiporter subunit G [Rhodococcus sp. (in: high G+C Gram-positive bacteria)]